MRHELWLGDRLQLASERNIRCRFVFGNDEIELAVLALPLPGDQWRLGDVLHRRPGPLDWANDRLVVGRDDRFENRFRVTHVFGPLKNVYRHLEQRVLKANRLRPRPVRCLGVGFGELLATLAGQAGFERMVWRPPDLAREPVATPAQ